MRLYEMWIGNVFELNLWQPRSCYNYQHELINYLKISVIERFTMNLLRTKNGFYRVYLLIKQILYLLQTLLGEPIDRKRNGQYQNI